MQAMNGNCIPERKSVRKSTAAKSAATAQRIKVRTLEEKKKVKKPKEEEWVPTQEELLEEAKITEQENLASLGAHYTFTLNVCFFLGWFISREISKNGK